MIKSYKLFTTPSCPNCPVVKEYMQGLDMQGDMIDASKPEGLQEARKFELTSVPTVVFLDEEGNVVAKCHSVDDIKNTLQ